jgi:DeoR/GlpR family transcriptional regulator of sugar metabolism
LQRFRASKAFLGASGITAEGPNDAGVGPGLIYGAMMRRASDTIILADHTKFNRPSLSVYGEWSANMTLVSDRPPEGKVATALKQAQVKVICA